MKKNDLFLICAFPFYIHQFGKRIGSGKQKAAGKPPRKKPAPETSIVEVTQQNGLSR